MKNTTVSLLAKGALLLATIIWGTTFFIMEGVINNIGIYSLLAFRFTFAAVLLAIILFKSLKKIDFGYIWRGMILGVLVITAYIFQTYGLADAQTTPGKNAFLTAIYCILVPFIFWGITKNRPDRYNIIAAILCLFGITLVSSSGNDFKSICVGDALTLLGGIFFAFHMVCVSIFSKNRDVLLLTMLQFLFAGICAFVPAMFLEKLPSAIPSGTIFAVIYLALFATCLCYILQNVGQKYTEPSSAALILSLEAVFGVIFSIIFTNEILTFKLFTGFAIIFIAILISELKPKFPKKKVERL
ncbi:MAG: EamA family transporter [Clostridia bacterium]|nr:EamA family transporter [Clostridia bacterium]